MDSIRDLNDPALRPRLEEMAERAHRNIYQEFVASHPELLNVDLPTDLQNKQIIDNIMAENGLPLTPENLERAFQVGVEAGQLTLPMYHPQEIAAFDRMSTKQMAQYLSARYQKPRPENAADLLPQFGERTWNHETPTLDDEQCQALREKLMKGMR
jgi:hypothetical protein